MPEEIHDSRRKAEGVARESCGKLSVANWAISEKKTNRMGGGGGRGGVFYFTPGNFRQNEASPPETPQNCVNTPRKF